MADETPRLPWERQRGESRQAFQAFVVYRDLGPARSTAKTAHDLGKSKTLMDGWSAKWSWVKRTDSYDAELDRRYREAKATELEAMAQRHVEIATTLQGLAIESLGQLQQQAQAAGSRFVLTEKDLLRFLEKGITMERLARGDVSSRVGVVGEGGALSPATDGPLADAVLNDPRARGLARELLRSVAGRRPEAEPGASGAVERPAAGVRRVPKRKKG